MSATSADDELLAMLLTNLRNAAATFGEGTPPYESIRTTVEEHLRVMKDAGIRTRLTESRQQRKNPVANPLPAFSDLAIRSKPA